MSALLFGGQLERKMVCRGELMYIMGGYADNFPYPPPPDMERETIIPPMPDELRTQARKAEAAAWQRAACMKAEAQFMEKVEAYQAEQKKRMADGTQQYTVKVEIQFPTFVWNGGAVGTEYTPDILNEILKGEIDRRLDLRLPSGRVIGGTTKGVSDEKIMVNAKRIEIKERSGGQADNETQRMLHRMERKLDVVEPLVQKVKAATKSMAAATMEFRKRVKLKDDDWAVYNAMQTPGQTGTQTAKDLGMKQWQVSRAWSRIKEAFEAAGYPMPGKEAAEVSEQTYSGDIHPKREGYHKGKA